MRRAALLLPLWLALTVGEHSVVHQCPTHAAVASSPDAAAAGQGHAHHAESTTPDGGHADHGCLCIDTCSTSAAAVLGTAPNAPRARVVLAGRPSLAAADVAAPANHQLRLPWANAPPVTANIG